MKQFLCIAFGLLFACSVSAMDNGSRDSGSISSRDGDPTHKQVKLLRPIGNAANVHLNTFCLDRNGNIVAAVGSTPEDDDSKVAGFVQTYSPDWQLLSEIPLDFAPTAVNFDKSGFLYVAGNSALCKFSENGELLKRTLTPNLMDQDNLREVAKEKLLQERAQMASVYERQLRIIQQALDAKDNDNSAAETEAATNQNEEEGDDDAEDDDQDVQLLTIFKNYETSQLESMLDTYSEQIKKFSGGKGIEDVEIDRSISQMGSVNSIAIGDSNVFVTCRSNEGFGYDIWKVTKDFENPEMVKGNLSGCCGQMDIQACDDKLLIAENTKFRVGIYDSKGKMISKFGQQDRTGDEGFGSCCNPMNVRCCENGDIITAESSIGTIKRFDAEGKLLGTIGKAKIGGGCKNVALAHDTKLDRYYMMYEDEGAICVLVKISEIKGETDNERETREATEGLGVKLIGKWKLKNAPATNKKVTADADEEQNMSLVDFYGFKAIDFQKENAVTAVPNSTQINMFEEVSWHAVRQDKQQLSISIFKEQVESLKIVAEFTNDKEIKFGINLDGGMDVQWIGTFVRDE